jgi:transposase
MRNKTDRNDARGIAQMMCQGWYRAVHVKNIDTQKMRSLLSNRKLLKRKLIDIENHIRGALRAYGLLIGTVGRGGYEARVSSTVALNWCKIANARSSPVRVVFADDLLSFRAFDYSNQGEVYGQEASG